jgi:hypothetical protein
MSLIVLVTVVGATLAASTHAAWTPHLRTLYLNRGYGDLEPAAKTYDFQSEDAGHGNVDWPVDIIFKNYSEVDKVKSALNHPFNRSIGNSTEHGRLNNQSADVRTVSDFGWKWDQDKGRKDAGCPLDGTDYHYRIYAAPRDRMGYNLRWGYWNIATTHRDTFECPTDPRSIGKYFCCSEDAEYAVLLAAVARWGTRRVLYHWFDYKNADNGRVSGGDHIFNSDGWASRVNVPP